MASGKIIYMMGMVARSFERITRCKVVRNDIKDNSRQAKEMAEDNIITQMEISTQVNGKTTSDTELADLKIVRLERSTRVNGKGVLRMEVENSNLPMGMYTRASG